MILLLGIGFVFPLGNDASAQVRTSLDGPILDSFDDGDYGDGLPTTWYTDIFIKERVYDATSGDFIISRGAITEPTHALAYAELENTLLSDVSIRIEAGMQEILDDGKLKGLEPAITIATRICWPHLVHVCGDGTGSENDSDYVYIDLRPNGDAVTARNAASDHSGPDGWRVAATGLLPEEEDVVMQVDAFGEDIKFWVWRPGERRPDEPLIQYTSEDQPRTDPGGVEFGSVYAKNVFRYVHVSDVPIVDLPGDFNSDWTLTVDDVDHLMTAIRTGESVSLMDLDTNDLVDREDLQIWVKDLKETWFGDANLDGEFNSGDLVDVFQAGKFETGLDASWADGDWNADTVFDSGDLVAAFQDGGFEKGPRQAVISVPEPGMFCLVGFGLTGLVSFTRRNSTRSSQNSCA